MEKIQEISNSNYPFKRAGSSFFRISKEKFILIGGANRSEEFDDIWELTLQSQSQSQQNSKNEDEQQQQSSQDSKQTQNKYSAQWKKLVIPLSSYTPRASQSSCFTGNAVYIYGGQNFQQNSHYDQLLKFDIGNNKISVVGNQQASVNKPTERNSSILSFDSKNNKLLLFGGADSQQPLGDLYSFDLSTEQWKKIETTNQFIQGLEMHSGHVYYTQEDLSKFNNQDQDLKNKKSKIQNAKIIDINIGDFTQEKVLINPQQQDNQTDQNNSQIDETSNEPSGAQQQQQNSNQQQNLQQETNQPQQQYQQVKLSKVDIVFDASNAIIEDDDCEQDDQEILAQQLQEELLLTQQQQNQQQQQEEQKLQEPKTFQYLIVIGGRYIANIQEKIWALDLETLQWHFIKALPSGICAHSSDLVEDVIYIYGGTDGQSFLDQLYLYNLKTNTIYQAQFNQSEIKNCQIDGRMAQSISYDPEIQKLIVFGGSGFEDETSRILSIDTTKINISTRVKKL